MQRVRYLEGVAGPGIKNVRRRERQGVEDSPDTVWTYSRVRVTYESLYVEYKLPCMYRDVRPGAGVRNANTMHVE